jgi:hypothetical protein
MPFFDHHWQLRWLGAGLAAVAAVLSPLRYLQVAAVWDHLCGWDMQPMLKPVVGTPFSSLLAGCAQGDLL